MKKILYLLIVFTFLISGLRAGNFTFKLKNNAGFPGISYRGSNFMFSYHSSNSLLVRIKNIVLLGPSVVVNGSPTGISERWLEKIDGERAIVLDDVDSSEDVYISCISINLQAKEYQRWFPESGIIKPLWGKGKGFKKISNDAVLQLEHVPSYSDFEHKEFRIKIGNWLSR